LHVKRDYSWNEKEEVGEGGLVVRNMRLCGTDPLRGLMNLAAFGNIVTSFSWFGVNMLGIGLHSYGFMDAAFRWLMAFDASQVLLMALGLLPTRLWMSFRSTGPSDRTPAPIIASRGQIS